MPTERGAQQPATDGKHREKELKRVYRKLKGVRSELSVKMKRLKKEYSEAGLETGEHTISDNAQEIDSSESCSEDDFGETMSQSPTKPAADIAQYEVKSLIDHKNRLRKRFWKLREEVRK